MIKPFDMLICGQRMYDWLAAHGYPVSCATKPFHYATKPVRPGVYFTGIHCHRLYEDVVEGWGWCYWTGSAWGLTVVGNPLMAVTEAYVQPWAAKQDKWWVGLNQQATP